MNKLNIKSAFVIILILILGVGIYLFFRASKNSTTDSGQNDKGFMSFFGDRKTKPVDETTVPGAKPGSNNNGDVNSNNPNDPNNDPNGNNSGGNTNQGGSGSGSTGSGSGSLSIKSIGTNQGGASGSGSSGVGGLGGNIGNNPNDPNNPNSSGQVVCPDSNPNCNNVVTVETVDCTPPKLPYTEAEINQLKDLVARFYNISSSLKTESDIKNEIDTRTSYIEIINEANAYTNQCIKEVKAEQAAPANLRKAIDNNPRWHPFISPSFVAKLPASKTTIDDLNSKKTAVNYQLSKYDAQIKFLESLNRNENQNNFLKNVKDDRNKALKELAELNQKIKDINEGNTSGQRILAGTFFPEPTERFNFTLGKKVDYIATGRRNDDWDRRERLWNMIGDRLWATSNFWTTSGVNQPWAIFYFYQGTAESEERNPLIWLIRDLPNSPDPNNPNPNAKGVKNFHRLQQLEDALGVW